MTSNPTLSTVDFSRLVPLVTVPAQRAPQDLVDQLDEKLASATLVVPEMLGNTSLGRPLSVLSLRSRSVRDGPPNQLTSSCIPSSNAASAASSAMTAETFPA